MLAVIDPRMPCSAKSRLKEICEVIELPPFLALDKRVASHPDMLLFAFNQTLFVCKDYYKEAKSTIDRIICLSGLELILTDDVLGKQYPNDIKFNTFTLSRHIIGKSDCISEEIKQRAICNGLSIANANQGYAKCSSVVLDNAVITSDIGIYNTVHSLGYDALLILPDNVLLEGYDYGFIGGASGVFNNTVYFCGDITKHKSGTEIVDFCKNRGYKVNALSDDPLYDVGTIIFFNKRQSMAHLR